ncbi:hypothetical protein Hanom_Chr11g01038511 [Helianthus anomalus]
MLLKRMGVSGPSILMFQRAPVRPKITVIPPKAAATVGEKAGEAKKAAKKPVDKTQEVEKTPEVVKAAGVKESIFEHVEKEVRVEEPFVQQTAPIEIEKITETDGEFVDDVHEEGRVETRTVEGEGVEVSGASGRKDRHPKTHPRDPSSILPDNTLGKIYYKSYDDSHANEIHTPVWKVKQGDTFVAFQPCKEWFMGAFPTGEVRHQRDRRHDALYRSHVYAHANCAYTSYQITREWRTIYLERAGWEKHRERLAAEAKLFEQAKAEFAIEKAEFEKEKKSE